jgi:thiol-disulfide isomerase/thioredoxin
MATKQRAGKQGLGGGAGKVPPRPGGASGNKAAKAPVPPRPSGRTAGSSTARPGARPAPRVSARQLAQRRRQRNIYMALGGTGLVIIVVVVIIAVSLTGPSKKAKTTAGLVSGEYDVPANLIAKVEGVPVKTLVNAALTYKSDAVPPQALPGGNKELTLGGKPEVLYIGAEYCPFCAAERWAMVMAFSKFGTFSGLHGTSSSATDTNASTPTFAFYHSAFTSKYLSFVPVETLANNGTTTLQTPTSAENALLSKWDTAPYTTQNGSIPFVYLGGKYLINGAQYGPNAGSPLSGMQFTAAVNYLTSGKNAMSKGAMAAAGFLVGDVCALTHGQPASVCSQVPSSLIGITTSSHSTGKASSTSPTTVAKKTAKK